MFTPIITIPLLTILITSIYYTPTVAITGPSNFETQARDALGLIWLYDRSEYNFLLKEVDIIELIETDRWAARIIPWRYPVTIQISFRLYAALPLFSGIIDPACLLALVFIHEVVHIKQWQRGEDFYDLSYRATLESEANRDMLEFWLEVKGDCTGNRNST